MIMADHSPSPSKEFHNKSVCKTKSGRASIRDVYKTYKSLIKRWQPNKHSSSKNHKAESKLKKANQAPNKKKEEEGEEEEEGGGGEGEGEEETMNAFHDLIYNNNNHRMRGGETTSPRGGFFKHRSMDNYFTTNLPSPLSRSASRRSNTPSRRSNTPPPPSQASTLSKSMSRKSTDNSTGIPSLSRNASRRSSTPIMFSNSNGLIKPPAIEKKLECTLEELCFGCTKKIMITRDVVTNTGQIVEEDEILTIKVKPGWKQGTKITFEGMGDERPGTYPADITFLIAEKRHPLFRREGDDLELAVEIPLVEALTGCTISVPILGGEKMTLTIDDIIYPGYEKTIAGQGMAVSKEEGRRGCLKIVFLIEFPTDLTDEQRSDAFNILEDSC